VSIHSVDELIEALNEPVAPHRDAHLDPAGAAERAIFAETVTAAKLRVLFNEKRALLESLVGAPERSFSVTVVQDEIDELRAISLRRFGKTLWDLTGMEE
jgi:hypothetical protein